METMAEREAVVRELLKQTAASGEWTPLPVCPYQPAAEEEAMRRWNSIAKPLQGLGRLEEMVNRIAGVTGSAQVCITPRAVLVLCADNGVVARGVTQTDQSVTAVVSANIARGTASVNRMARTAQTDVIAVDVGIAADMEAYGVKEKLLDRKIAYGTKDFLSEPAMSREETLRAMQTGIELVGECRRRGYRILATGEMGIGNTTTSAAVAAGLLQLPAAAVTGRGAGLPNEKLLKKQAVIQEAVRKYDLYQLDTLEILRCVGGLDLAALTGVFLGGGIFELPVVIDGMISAVSALCAARLEPSVWPYLLPSHMSREPVTAAVMEQLGLRPLIDGSLALGEGTGAVLLFPMLDAALAVYRESATFADAKISAYEDYGRKKGK